MANLVDIFTQSSGLKGETTVLSTSEDLPKDKPSLFDSLLKTSIEDIENSSAQNTNSKIVSQNITSNLENSSLESEVVEVNTKSIDEGLDSEAINLDENSNSEEVIKDLSKNITNELNKDNTKKDEIKEPTKNIQNSISSKNSLLDRLVLEVKNSNLEQVPKVEQILSEPLENVDIVNSDKSFIKSLDKVIEGLKNQNNSEEKLDSEKIIISQDDKLVEIIKEQEILIEDINGNNLQIKDENSQNLDDVNLETTQNLSQIVVNSEDIENQIETSTVLKDSLNSENILIVEDEVANSDAIKNVTGNGTQITADQLTKDATKGTITLDKFSTLYPNGGTLVSILLNNTAAFGAFLKQYNLEVLNQIRDVILHQKGNETLILEGGQLGESKKKQQKKRRNKQ